MRKPEVYLDMDGVIADFFAEYAKLAGVQTGNYREIPPAKVDPTLDKMVGTNFFYRLPKFPSADALIQMIVKTFDHYHICSSPLRGDHAGSEKWKRAWIKENLKIQPKNIYITPNKAKYAVQSDGTPNILIDDRGSNITAWEAKGGVGIKYQADEDGLDVVMNGFRRAIEIIKGQQKHEPQKLQSLDRGKMIAVQQSGDSDEENVKEQSIPDINTGLSVLGADITTGDIARVAQFLGLGADEAITYGRHIYDIATTKIPGTNYRVADAINLGADVIGPAGKAKLLKSLDGKKTKDALSQLGQSLAKRQAVKSTVSFDKNVSSPSSSVSANSQPPAKVKRKYSIGEKIRIKVGGVKYVLPIINISPSGYVLDVSSIPGRKKGETMTVPHQLDETASTGATSAANIATTGNSSHIAGGTPSVLRRWSGEPGSSGTTGKSIKHKPVKNQTAKDNPVTNPDVGNNLIA